MIQYRVRMPCPRASLKDRGANGKAEGRDECRANKEGLPTTLFH